MLKSKLFLLVMAFFFLFAISSLNAAVITVNNSTTPPPLTYPTIQAGIDVAADWDSIHVMFTGKDYNGATLSGRDGLKIGGEPGVTVDGASTDGFVFNGSTNCNISGFDISNFRYGVYLHSGSDNNEIYNNTFHYNDYGVNINGDADNLNDVHDNCFLSQANTPQGNDNNTYDNNTWDWNFWSEWTSGNYLIDGAAGVYDVNPKSSKLRIVPATSNVQYNTNFDVYVKFVPTALCQLDMMSIEYNVGYDVAKLRLVSVENAVPGLIPAPPNGQTIVTPDTLTGTINVAQTFLGGGGIPDSGNVVKITFHGANAWVTDVISLAVVNCVDNNGDRIPITPTGATVNIKDMTKPVITLILPASGGTYGPAGPTFTKLMASDDTTGPLTGLERIYYRLDAAAWLFWATIPGAPVDTFNFAPTINTAFTGFYPGLAEGPHTIKFRVRDYITIPYGGNYSDSVTWLFTKDVTAPTFDSVTVADIGLSEPAEPGWSNQRNVQVKIYAGGDADSMKFDPSSDLTYPTEGIWHKFASPVTCTLTASQASKTIWVQVKDAYANESAWKSASIILDTLAPALTGFVLDGGALYCTDGIAAGTFPGSSLSDYDFWKFNLTGNLSGPLGWKPAADPVPCTLSTPDGLKTVNAVIRDKAGNVSPTRSDGITLDTQKPSATITLSSKSGATTPPYSTKYTNSLTVFCQISATGSPTQMRLWNEAGAITAQVTFRDTATVLLSGADGPRWLDVELWDAALNYDVFRDTIILDTSVPGSPPAIFSAVPGGSVVLNWTIPAGVAKVRIRTNPWGYPLYPPPVPPYPGFSDGFFVADVQRPVTTYTYVCAKDAYYFSVFSLDSAGNPSATAANAEATSYILGDIVPGGSVNFDDVDYFSDYFNYPAPLPVPGQPCDFAPTYDGSSMGIPKPDGLVNFGDLVILALNFGEGTAKVTPIYPSGPIVLNLNIGDKVSVGDVFEAKLTINDASSVKAMHLILDYNNSVLKLLGVTKGELSADPSIFFWADKEKVDINLAKLGKGLVIGGSGEVAILKFKMVTQGTTELTSNLLDVRDVNGKPIEVSFNKVNLAAVPITFALSQNYPNPFNPKTQISFALPVASKVTLKIYNIMGQLVKTLVDAEIPAGHHTVTWSGTNSSGSEVGTGIYFYRLQTENFTSVKKMVLMK